MRKRRLRRGAVAAAALAAFAGLGAAVPGTAGGAPASAAPGAAETASAAPAAAAAPAITLGTAMFRDFAPSGVFPESGVLSKLPDIRLRIDLGRNDWWRSAPVRDATITGVEVEVPRVSGLWLGVEEPAAADESPRATLSIQKSF